MSSFTREVSEQQLFPDALHENAQFFKVLFESSPVGKSIVALDGKLERVNRSFADMLGYTIEELQQMNFLDITNPEDIQASQELARSLLDGKRDVCRIEKRYLAKNNDIVWVDLNATLFRDPGGRPMYFLTTVLDINERKKAESALKENEFRLRRAELIAGLGNWEIDLSKKIVTSSEAARAIYGVPNKPMTLDDIQRFPLPEYRDMLNHALENLINHGTPYNVQFKIRRANDNQIVDIHSVAHYDSEKNFVFGTIQDITEEVSLKHQLIQAQKMEAIGTLAGGFAHDFKNILQIVLGFLDLTLLRKDVSGKLRSDLEKVRSAAMSGSELVREMLIFSRKTNIRLELLNLNDLVKQIQSLLTRTIPKMIKIEMIFGDDLGSINGDPVQIEQVLMNLAINALDAMPDGGRLIFETQNVTLDAEYCRRHLDSKPGRYALLSVSDTGKGMDSETVNRIFEPFFTTKEQGKGTGLGLSVVYGIVKQHGGKITCYSEPSVGTTFRIYFPEIAGAPDSHLAEIVEPPKGRSETILVVDDEPNVAELASRMLTGANYRVITTSNGKEALDIYNKLRETIKLVILDLIMPDISGKQCLQSLSRINPKVKVMVASGYAGNGVATEVLDLGAKGFIEKPFNRCKILVQIRKIIDEE